VIIEFLVLVALFIPVLIWACRRSYNNGVNYSVGAYLQGIKRADIQTRAKTNPHARSRPPTEAS